MLITRAKNILHLSLISLQLYLVAKPAKRRKTKAETALTEVLATFKTMQEESGEWFRAWEEERWRKETELEERRRREERAHELQVLQLLTRQNPPQHRQQHRYSFGLPSEASPYSCTSPEQSPTYQACYLLL